MRYNLTSFILSCLGMLCHVGAFGAEVLMLDFGPTTVIGDSLTNSPYHEANGSFSGTVWNQVEKRTISAGHLRWADGTTARGLSLRIGVGADVGTTRLKIPAMPMNSHSLSKATKSGIYQGTSVGRDAIFHGQHSGHSWPVGVQIRGLAPGRYSVYVVARNTSIAGLQTQHVSVGATADSTSLDFSIPAYTSRLMAYTSSADATTQWTEGANYVRFIVLVETGDVLNIASVGGEGTEKRGFINCVQIVTLAPQSARIKSPSPASP